MYFVAPIVFVYKADEVKDRDGRTTTQGSALRILATFLTLKLSNP